METLHSYFTIRNASEGIFKDRGSKFLAYTFPVHNEEEIKCQLEYLRREHPSARHHCYAWRIGTDKEITRANDDGEPSGTGGKPILGQIVGNELRQILLVVVRYFGGTLLGTNGLINAYKNAASDAIANAGIVEHFIMNEYKVVFEAEDLSAVMRLLKETGAKVLTNDYTQQHELIFRVKRQLASNIEKRFTGLYKTRLDYLQTI